MWNVITGFFYIENSGFQNKTLKYKTSIYLINNTVEKCQKMLKTLQKKRKILNQQIIFPHSHDKYISQRDLYNESEMNHLVHQQSLQERIIPFTRRRPHQR